MRCSMITISLLRRPITYAVYYTYHQSLNATDYYVVLYAYHQSLKATDYICSAVCLATVS